MKYFMVFNPCCAEIVLKVVFINYSVDKNLVFRGVAILFLEGKNMRVLR